MGIWSASSTAAATVITAWMAPSIVQADNYHPGKVVERGSDAPISVNVKAWVPGGQTNAGVDCPEFGGAPLDAMISDPADGAFGLKVSTDIHIYYVVYCANGYHRKVDRYLRNDVDGSPVVPMPAKLRRQSGEVEVETDTVNLAISALNELAYLYEINPEGFGSALQGYSSVVGEEDGSAGEVLAGLSKLVAQWSISGE